MALDFPASPSTGATYTGPNGVVWIWDGVKWTVGTQSGAYLPLSGGALTGNLSTGTGVGTGAAIIEVGDGRSGDGIALIDLHAAGGGTDFEFRLIRNPGVNGVGGVQNFGTGALEIVAGVGTGTLRTISLSGTTGVTTFPYSIGATGGTQTLHASAQGGTVQGSQLVAEQLIGLGVSFDGVNWHYLHTSSGGWALNGDGGGNFSLVTFPAGGAVGTVASPGVVALGFDGGGSRALFWGTDLIMGQKFSSPYVVTVAYEFGQFTAFYSPGGNAGKGGIILGSAANPQFKLAEDTQSFYNWNSTAAFATFTSGGTANVSGAWSVISGEAVKEGIEPYTRGLDAILALEPVQFSYRKGTPFADADDAPSRRLMGLVAEQVRPHVPEICGSAMLPARELNIDAAVDATAVSETFDTLEPGNLVYALINAVKELQAQIDQLKPAATQGKS